MRLEPHEFKQCLVSLGYNLKEGDKVCCLSDTHYGIFNNYSMSCILGGRVTSLVNRAQV